MKSTVERDARPGRLWLNAIAVVLASTLSGPVFAQEKTGDAGADEAAKLDAIEVTGSRIKRTDIEGPSPIVSISRQQIENEGYTSVVEVLQNLTQNSGGSFSSQGGLFGSTGGASAVDLRGFGAGRTLVLVDGRRLPVFPTANVSSQPADLSSIPFASIDRIEILTDGASAIYGSDAVGGVINIITKKRFEGRSAKVRVGGTDDGGGSNKQVQYFDGFDSAAGSLSISANYQENKALGISQRAYSASDFTAGGNGSLFGSNWVSSDGSVSIPDPNCGADDYLGGNSVLRGTVCRFDRTAYRQYLPESRNASVALRLDRKFGEIENYTKFSYYESNARAQAEPNAYGGGEGFRPNSTQLIPENIHNFGIVPAGAPNNPTTGTGNELEGSFQRRLVEFGPRRQADEVTSLSFLTGFTGTVAGYNWDVGLSYNQIRLNSLRPNIVSSVLDNEVANRGLDLFAPIPQAVVDRISFLSSKTSESRNTLLDVTVSGPLPINLSGGPAQIAVHMDLEDQRYADVFDPITELGDAFDGGVSGAGDRNYAALGVEVLLPVLENLELNIAGRYDRYFDDSEVGGAFSPKVSLAYRPIESLMLRASAGKIFRAPSLQDLFGGQTVTFESVSDPIRCLSLGGTPDTDGSAIPSCNPDSEFYTIQSAQVLQGSNENLEEETGTSYNFGVIWEASRLFSVSVDLYQIELENIVSTLGTQEIINFCAYENQYCDLISVNYATGIDTNNDGQLLDEIGQQIVVVNQNLAFKQIRGVDTTFRSEVSLGEFGKLSNALIVSWVDSIKTRSVDGAPTEQVIDSTPLTGERVPEYRSSLSTDWSMGNLGATVRGNYVHKMPGQFSPPGQYGNVPGDDYIPSWTTWDVQVRYDFGRFGLVRVGIDNVFDRGWPLDPTALGGNRPNQFITGPMTAYVDSLGRSGYLSYELKF